MCKNIWPIILLPRSVSVFPKLKGSKITILNVPRHSTHMLVNCPTEKLALEVARKVTSPSISPKHHQAPSTTPILIMNISKVKDSPLD